MARNSDESSAASGIRTAQRLPQPPPQLRQDVAAALFVNQTQSQLDALAEQAEQLVPE